MLEQSVEEATALWQEFEMKKSSQAAGGCGFLTADHLKRVVGKAVRVTANAVLSLFSG